MKIDSKTVERVATLAQLELAPAEVESYRRRLERILDLVAQLEHLPDEASLAAVDAGIQLRERPDIVTPSLGAELAVREASQRSGTLFQVPKIID